MALLGIDVGTGGTRALIIDEQGRLLGAATAEHVAFASPQPGWSEQDPRDWWQAASQALEEVGEAALPALRRAAASRKTSWPFQRAYVATKPTRTVSGAAGGKPARRSSRLPSAGAGRKCWTSMAW